MEVIPDNPDIMVDVKKKFSGGYSPPRRKKRPISGSLFRTFSTGELVKQSSQMDYDKDCDTILEQKSAFNMESLKL